MKTFDFRTIQNTMHLFNVPSNTKITLINKAQIRNQKA